MMNNFKKTLICLSAFLLGLFSFESRAAERQVISMNDGWKFKLGDGCNYSQIDFDDSSWRTLSVPHDWSIEGKYDKTEKSGPQGGYMPCGIGWYRKEFSVDKGMTNKRFFIRFDGVYMKSQVWINNTMVGEYPNGYNTFEYDITPFIKPGETNLLAVKVDNSLQPSSRWYTGSGIYRDVNLVVTDQLHFTHDGVFVTTKQVSPSEATLNIDYKIINHRYPETVFAWTDNTSHYVWINDGRKDQKKPNNRIQKECQLTSTLYDSNGMIVATVQTKHLIGDFTDNEMSQKLQVPQPLLWSDKTPHMYRLVSTVGYDGKVIDQVSSPVGIRDIHFSVENGMTVNGEPVKIKGVCLHQNVGCFGAAIPTEIWRQRLMDLKTMGCNAVRLSHYPFAPAFYDLCDSLGLYVSNEIFDEWNRGQEWDFSETSFGKMAYSYHLYFDQWADTDLRKMIRRDRNHPCVIMYMLGNEIPNQRIKGLEIARKLMSVCKEEDPTRPVTAACDFFVGANVYGFMDVFDIAGYNYIDRIHKDDLYLSEHKKYPNRILLGTETYHNTRNHVSVRDNKSVIGEFVWVGYDYLGEIYWPDYRGWNEGIFDIAGFPKSEYFLRKSYWSEEPVVYPAVADGPSRNFDWSPRNVKGCWNWEMAKDSLLDIYVYSNCDEVELSLNGKSLGRKPVDKNLYFASWKHPFKSGKLMATGYNKGKKVVDYTIKSAADPAKIGYVIKSGSSPIKRVEVSVRDKKGVLVNASGLLAEISPVGNIKVIGLDNGNQYDPSGEKYTSNNQIKTYEGKFVVYVEVSPEDPGYLDIRCDKLNQQIKF